MTGVAHQTNSDIHLNSSKQSAANIITAIPQEIKRKRGRPGSTLSKKEKDTRKQEQARTRSNRQYEKKKQAKIDRTVMQPHHPISIAPRAIVVATELEHSDGVLGNEPMQIGKETLVNDLIIDELDGFTRFNDGLDDETVVPTTPSKYIKVDRSNESGEELLDERELERTTS